MVGGWRAGGHARRPSGKRSRPPRWKGMAFAKRSRLRKTSFPPGCGVRGVLLMPATISPDR